MKSLRLFALGAFFCVVSSFGAQSFNVTLGNGSTTSFNVLTPPSVSVALGEPAECVWVNFNQGDGERVRVYLNGSGTSWSGTMPVNHAGTVSYTVSAEGADGAVATGGAGAYSVTETLDEAHYPNIAAWTQISSSSKSSLVYTETSSSSPLYRKWFASNVWKDNTVNAYFYIRAPKSTASSYQSGNRYSYIANMTSMSVGTIWFKARFVKSTTTESGRLVIESASKLADSNPRTVLADVQIPALESGSDWIQFRIEVANPAAGLIAFRNMTDPDSDSDADLDASSIAISDIVLCPPEPGVTLVKDEIDYEPGYPSVQDPVSFRVTVAQKNANCHADNITPMLVWRQKNGLEWSGWNYTVLTNVAGRTLCDAGTYATTLTNHIAGDFQYFYRADFTGYAPVFQFNRNPEPNNAFTTVNNLDACRAFVKKDETQTESRTYAGVTYPASQYKMFYGKVCESRSPAYFKNFIDTYVYNGNIIADAYYDLVNTPYVGTTNDLSYLYDLGNLDSQYGAYPSSRNDRSFQIEAQYDYCTLSAPEGIRRFRSQFRDFGLVPMDVNPDEPSLLSPSYKMDQVGDYEWQAVVYVTNQVDSYFLVTSAWRRAEADIAGVYTDNKSSYDWGQIDQSELEINPPTAGTVLEVEEGTGAPEGWYPPRIQFADVTNGFVVLSLNTTNGAYQVFRASWQDFNTWQANDRYYARSQGLYNKTTHESNLEGRSVTQFDDVGFVELEASGAVTPDTFYVDKFANGLRMRGVTIVEENCRKDAKSTSSQRNRAYKITSGTMVGSLETSGSVLGGSAQGGRGRDTFSMRVRAGTDREDTRVAFYRPGLAFTGGYAAMGVYKIDSMSEDHPSVSLYGNYQDEGNYFEARLTQRVTPGEKTDTTYLDFEVFSCVNGVLTQVGKTQKINNQSFTSSDWPCAIIMTLEPNGSAVSVSAKVYQRSKLQATSSPSGNPVAKIDATSVATKGVPVSGTIGVQAAEAAATFQVYVYDLTDSTIGALNRGSSTATAKKAVNLSAASDWNLGGGKREYNRTTPWTVKPNQSEISGFASNKPTSIVRGSPTVYYAIKAFRSNKETCDAVWAPVEDDSDWALNWVDNRSASYNVNGVKSVSGFGWQTVTFPMHFWDDTYLRIETVATSGSNGSSGLLVVDDLACSEWRGVTVYDRDYGEGDPRNQTMSWKGTYATIKADPGVLGARGYELDRTRANVSVRDAVDQYIITPRLGTGVGDISFRYVVDNNHPVRFSVQLVDENGNDPVTIETFNAAAGEKASIYVPVCTNIDGRLRILMDRYLDDEKTIENWGSLYVTELMSTDYPADADTAWVAYNLLVSRFIDDLAVKFDSGNNTRSAELNDSETRDTNGNTISGSPYLQSPRMVDGVGDVSFWYRADPEVVAAGASATIYLKVCDRQSPREEDWTTIATIEGINNSDWRHFYQRNVLSDARYLRIYGVAGSGSYNRVLFDNILVTEPPLASISIGEITFDPDIPTVRKPTYAHVKLVNPHMNPRDISVELQYYKQSDIYSHADRWGYSNWVSRIGSSSRIAFTNTVTEIRDYTGTVVGLTTNTYDFISVEPIPTNVRSRMTVDDVIQYNATASYTGTDGSRLTTDSSTQHSGAYKFTNPSWYEPIDLNKTFATTDSPVSHFWVFSCDTNVFVNEINVVYSASELPTQFVELMGPEGADISGWKLYIHDLNEAATEIYPDEERCFWTNTLASGAAFIKDESTESDKGWGFYVLGKEGVANRNDQLLADDFDDNYMYYKLGALTLKRSMGAIVDRVYWGDDLGMPADARDKFTYTTSRAGKAGIGYTISLTGDMRTDPPSLRWDTFEVTPGAFNYSEELAIWSLDGKSEEPQRKIPDVLPPEITSITSGASGMELEFRVTLSGAGDLQTGDYVWTVEYASELSGLTNGCDSVEISGVEISESAGVGSFTVSNLPADTDAKFFRIRAVPTSAE